MRKEHGGTFVKLWCVIASVLYQSNTCNGQLATALIRELRGLNNAYHNQGFVTKPTCKHEKTRTPITFNDATKFTSCLRDIVQKGSYPRHADQYKRTVNKI